MNRYRPDLDTACILNVIKVGSARRQVTNRALKDPWWLQLRLSIRREERMGEYFDALGCSRCILVALSLS